MNNIFRVILKDIERKNEFWELISFLFIYLHYLLLLESLSLFIDYTYHLFSLFIYE